MERPKKVGLQLSEIQNSLQNCDFFGCFPINHYVMRNIMDCSSDGYIILPAKLAHSWNFKWQQYHCEHKPVKQKSIYT